MSCAGTMSIGFRNMSTLNKLKNPHEVQNRPYIISIWRVQGFVEIIREHWMYVGVWLQLLKTNRTIHLTSDFVFYEKVLQEVNSKDHILKFIVDLNRNYVRLY